MREPGYYWVKRKVGWVIAEWTLGYWYVTGVGYGIPSDGCFIEIDERRIVREEPSDGR